MTRAVFAIMLLSAAAASSAPAQAAEPATPPSEETRRCKKVPAGKKILKLQLKPDSEVTDLIGWMSMISCKNFVFDAAQLRGKTVTVLAPELMTLEEAGRLFIDTLASVDLRLEPLSRGGKEGEIIRIVPTRGR